MGWIASLCAAVLTAVAGLLAAGTVASLAVDWYQISSFEGGAGFFVVGMAIFGLFGGFLIGLVVSRVVAARPHPGFAKALGSALGVVLVLSALIAGVSRLFADVPPEIDGQTLFLQVELRWPRAATTRPELRDGVGYVRLGASNGSHVRRTEDGPLFVDDLRQEEGRWIVPGAVGVFTSRGQRLIELGVGETRFAAFLVPLPGRPRAEHQTWSDWLPHARDGEPALPDQFTYRFRVLRRGEPMRRDVIGPFAIDTLVSSFHRFDLTGEAGRYAATGVFRVSYKGNPLPEFQDAGSVAVISLSPTALLIEAEPRDGVPACALVRDAGDRPRIEAISGCVAPIQAQAITSDVARFRAAQRTVVVPGWVDRLTFERPGLYKLGRAVLDTRNFTARPLDLPSRPSVVSSVPPLGLSPDEHSVIWFALRGSAEEPVLGVTDFHTNRTYTFDIDRARMRYSAYEKLDPAWVAHHFEWIRTADGSDTLVERAGFVPLPHQGEVTLGKPGEYQTYTIRPGGEPLRAAIVELLLTELGGERLPDRLDGYERRVSIDGKTIGVTVVESGSYVSVSMNLAEGDPELMKKIARRLDAALATGKYDDRFSTPRKSPDS